MIHHTTIKSYLQANPEVTKQVIKTAKIKYTLDLPLSLSFIKIQASTKNVTNQSVNF